MGKIVKKSQTHLAVAYCRVSTEHEEQLESIKKQQEQWLEFFEKKKVTNAQLGVLCHRQYIVDENTGKAKKGKFVLEQRADGLYIDEGITGTAINNRRAFQRMIDDAKARKFDVIYVEDVSRFSRSVEDFTKTIKDLREVGVYVYFKKENTMTNDPKHDAELTLRITFAQEESRMKQDRLKWAVRHTQEKGGWTSIPPYGYDVTRDKYNIRVLTINPSKSEVVKEIYKQYVYEHCGIAKICRNLEAEGIPSPKNTNWTQQSVKRILQNQIYVGKQYTHTVESYDLTRHTKVDVPEDKWIIHLKPELRIIDEDTYNLAQIELDKRHEEFSKGNGTSTKHALSTLIYCDYCKGTFKRKKRHTYSRKDGTSRDIGYEWTCQLVDMYGATKKAKIGRCSGGRNAIIEAELIEAIKYEITLLKNQRIDDWLETYFDAKYKRLESLDINALEKEKSDIQKMLDELLRLKIENKISDDMYDESIETYVEKRKKIDISINAINTLEAKKMHQIQLFNNYKKAIQSFDVRKIKEHDCKTEKGAEANGKINAQLKNIFHKIYVRYILDEDGKKIPQLRFVYNFLGTNDDELDLMSEEVEHIWTRLDEYKRK